MRYPAKGYFGNNESYVHSSHVTFDAATLARGFTMTFAGIALNHVPAFIAAQLVGAALASWLCGQLFPADRVRPRQAVAPAE
jgi:hypothetical protein